MIASSAQASPFDSERNQDMNFLLDLFFVTLQQVWSTVISSIFQVPLDVITSVLTGVLSPAAA